MVKYRKRVKNDVLMYLNARRLIAALGIQSMILPTPIIGASIELVKLPADSNTHVSC